MSQHWGKIHFDDVFDLRVLRVFALLRWVQLHTKPHTDGPAVVAGGPQHRGKRTAMEILRWEATTACDDDLALNISSRSCRVDEQMVQDHSSRSVCVADNVIQQETGVGMLTQGVGIAPTVT